MLNVADGYTYPRALLGSPIEVRTAAAEYLKCVISRRSGYPKHALPKIKSVFASSQLDVSQKMSTCYFLRHHSPFSLQPKGPTMDETTGSIVGFKWYWMPVASDCVFEDLLSDLSVSDFYQRGRLISNDLYPGRNTSFSRKRKCPEGLPDRDLHAADAEGLTRDSADAERLTRGVDDSLVEVPATGRSYLCNKSFLRVNEDPLAFQRVHEYWEQLSADDLRKCEAEFLRTPGDEDLVKLAIDWAIMMWQSGDGRSYYLRHMSG
ncbi:hypothetical protein DFP72DRAFT_874157 [Ephemerocybe angulata]|uniref:Uncharacterized protein n=1 Tax=Ephemerocybe angulata TaxID=980116 RepID=A0A8H6IGK1_9AGAR|nr:hypothetical protein DFP72DRAFT_874157 [Tulosesus angulatus]